MKLFYLPALIWALAMSPLFAQKQLPPSIQPYAVNWSYSLKQMFQASGYEVPGPLPEYELKPAIKPRSVDLRLDSTVSYVGYELPTPDSTPLFRHVYTYPDDEVEVITEHFYHEQKWSVLTQTTLIRDDFGRLVDIFAMQYDEDSGTFIPDSRIVSFPRGTSEEKIDSFFIYAWSAEIEDWVRQLATWNVYDDQDRLIESTSSTELFQVPLVFVDRYSYNAAGDLQYVQSYNVDGGVEFPGDRDEYVYDNHILQSVITMASDGAGGYFPQRKTTYTYFGSGQQENISLYEYDFEKQDWKLNRVDGHIYDDEDRLSARETVALENNGIWSRHLDRYDYIRGDYLASESGLGYDNNGEAWILEDVKYYYYTELVAVDPVVPEDQALFMFPNPTSGTVQVKLTGSVVVYLYTLTGQQISRIQLPPGEKVLDLSALPAGIYQVRAKSDEDYFSGKLVIQ